MITPLERFEATYGGLNRSLQIVVTGIDSDQNTFTITTFAGSEEIKPVGSPKFSFLAIK